MSDYLHPKVKALLVRKRAEGREDAEANRAAVLAHPDLAARLTQAPLEYAHPGQWNGFVPPAQFNEALNTSPRRQALVEIVTEAHTRQEQAQGRPA